MAEPFRRPLGLFLQGGGSLGAWQAGALEALDAAGVRFDHVMGYSIGALNGAALALGKLPEALSRWRTTDWRIIKFSPRLSPLSWFATPDFARILPETTDEEAAKKSLRLDLTVVSASPEDAAPVNARFSPGARGQWDAPLAAHLAGSCAIPRAFPPIDVEWRGRQRRLIDGGVPMDAPVDLSPLGACADLLVLELVTATERGRRPFLPWNAKDQAGRETSRCVLESALAGFRGPRVLRLEPSRRLEPLMLDFRARGLRAMLAQGADDARAFLAAREA